MKLAILARRSALAVAAALLIPPATAGAAVSVGHSGWTWGNPVPQGNTLRALEFSGQRGYAAGQFGTLLRTDDGGATWVGIATGITSDLRRIRLISQDSIVIGGACTVRRSDDGGQSFTRLPWTSSDEGCTSPVSSLAFPSSAVGYLVLEDGNVLRSADAGRTWGRRVAVPGTRSAPAAGQAVPNDIAFVSDDTGFAATTAGQIFRTTDGGGSWTPVDSGRPPLAGLHFVDANTGYAVGAGGTFLKTIDGGATWTPLAIGTGTPPLDFIGVRCADAANCMAVTARGDQVIRTSDGGASFTSVSPSTDAVFAAAFVSGTRAVAVGIGGVTVVSDDGGSTWSPVGGRLPGNFSGLRAFSSSTAFAFGPNGALARTVNGGQAWTNVGVSTPNEVRDVSFPSADVGFALDSRGQLLRTDNSGASWSILNTGTSAAPQAVHAFTADTILLAGPRGLRRSTNGGAEFAPVRDRLVARARVNRLDEAAGAIFAWQRGGKPIAFSTNGGVRWQRIRRLPTRSGAQQYDWISRRVGFAVAANGTVYRTGNGGRSWSALPALGTADVRQIAFSSATDGYALGVIENDLDFLFRTTDGGRTFRPQRLQRGFLLDIAAPGGGTDFALGQPVVDPTGGGPGSNTLFHTTTGGDQGRETTLTLRRQRARRGSRPRRRPRFVTVQITGRLTPPEGGERIIISRLGAGRGAATQVVTAASNGAFTSTWTIRGTGRFVAHWQGDDDRRAVGSRVLTVTAR
jgi:photosystem II stability/assembly factor-like uncharacterized protein